MRHLLGTDNPAHLRTLLLMAPALHSGAFLQLLATVTALVLTIRWPEPAGIRDTRTN